MLGQSKIVFSNEEIFFFGFSKYRILVFRLNLVILNFLGFHLEFDIRLIVCDYLSILFHNKNILCCLIIHLSRVFPRERMRESELGAFLGDNNYFLAISFYIFNLAIQILSLLEE